MVTLYENAGYDCLALSDHRAVNNVCDLASDRMTLISGVELHPAGPRGITWHLLALNVPEDFPVEYPSAQAAADAVNAVGGIIFAAHPYWCGLTAAEVCEVKGFAGIEVYNASCRYVGKEFCQVIWDEALDQGMPYSALAVDDSHCPEELFRGWTMICAENRNVSSLVEALKKGEFYSTMGPEIYSMEYRDGIFHAEFSPVSSAVLVSNRHCGYCGAIGDKRLEKEASVTTELTCRISGSSSFPAGHYFRLQLRTADGRYAWSNPIMV
jgi:hypothetical protein